MANLDHSRDVLFQRARRNAVQGKIASLASRSPWSTYRASRPVATLETWPPRAASPGCDVERETSERGSATRAARRVGPGRRPSFPATTSKAPLASRGCPLAEPASASGRGGMARPGPFARMAGTALFHGALWKKGSAVLYPFLSLSRGSLLPEALRGGCVRATRRLAIHGRSGLLSRRGVSSRERGRHFVLCASPDECRTFDEAQPRGTSKVNRSRPGRRSGPRSAPDGGAGPPLTPPLGATGLGACTCDAPGARQLRFERPCQRPPAPVTSRFRSRCLLSDAFVCRGIYSSRSSLGGASGASGRVG